LLNRGKDDVEIPFSKALLPVFNTPTPISTVKKTNLQRANQFIRASIVFRHTPIGLCGAIISFSEV
jgi:hypothetical protein